MKRLLLLFGVVALLFAACSNEPDDEVKNLKSVIESVKENEPIDVGQFDGEIDEEGEYTVNAKGVTITNMDLPKSSLAVSEKVGSGDFTLENSKLDTLYIDGGESVTIKNCTINNVVVRKKGVTVVLNGSTKIAAKVSVESDECTLDADETVNSIKEISLSSSVKKLAIGASDKSSINISNITTKSAEGGDATGVEIIVGNRDAIKIENADDTLKESIKDAEGNEIEIGKDDNNKPSGGDDGNKDDNNKPSGGDDGNKDDNNKPSGGDDGNKGDNNKPSGGDDGNKDDNNKPSGGDDGNKGDNNKPSSGDDGNKGDDNKPSGGDDDNKEDDNKPSGGSGSQDSVKYITFIEEQGITSEKQSDGSVKIIRNAAFYEHAFCRVEEKIPVKANENYEVSIELKADKAFDVLLFVKDFDNYSTESSVGEFKRISTEWKTFTIKTGFSGADWTDGHLQIEIASENALYARNFSCKKIDGDSSLGIGTWYVLPNDKAVVVKNSTKDSITLEFGSENEGVNVFTSEALDLNAFYKLECKITTEKAVSGDGDDQLQLWLHTLDNSYETSGTNALDFKAGEAKPVTFYFATLKDDRKNRTYANPMIYIRGISNTVTISDITVTPTSIDEVRNDGMDFYVTGSADNWWRCQKEFYITDKATFRGQYILCEKKRGGDDWGAGWESKDKTVMSIRMLSDSAKKLGLHPAPNDGDELIFENASSEDRRLDFSLDDNFNLDLKSSPVPESYWGMIGNKLYLSISDNSAVIYESFDSKDFRQGTEYTVTYKISFLKRRDESKDAKVDSCFSYWNKSNGTLINLKSDELDFSATDQIEKSFQFVYGEKNDEIQGEYDFSDMDIAWDISGYNAIVAIESVEINPAVLKYADLSFAIKGLEAGDAAWINGEMYVNDEGVKWASSWPFSDFTPLTNIKTQFL